MRKIVFLMSFVVFLGVGFAWNATYKAADTPPVPAGITTSPGTI